MEGDGGEMAVLSGFPCLGRGQKISTEERCWELSVSSSEMDSWNALFGHRS